MLSGYVQSAYVEWDLGDSFPAVAKSIVSASAGSRFRLFGIQFIPSSNPAASDKAITRVQLFDGDPDDGGESFFEDQLSQANYTTTGFQNIAMLKILPHGVLATLNGDVYARVSPSSPSDLNLSFVSLTYQLG
tara:strand:- start:587 stop:985 length:399 start_codon:yes stop_codon:yes gene_type:complete